MKSHQEPTEREFLEGLRYEDKFPEQNQHSALDNFAIVREVITPFATIAPGNGFFDALAALTRLEEQLEALDEKPDQPLLNAARRLVKATDNAERNYALGDLYNAMKEDRDGLGTDHLHSVDSRGVLGGAADRSLPDLASNPAKVCGCPGPCDLPSIEEITGILALEDSSDPDVSGASAEGNEADSGALNPASHPVDSGGNAEGGKVPDRSPSGPEPSPATEPDVSERDPGTGTPISGSLALSETIRAALSKGRWTDLEAIAALDELVSLLRLADAAADAAEATANEWRRELERLT